MTPAAEDKIETGNLTFTVPYKALRHVREIANRTTEPEIFRPAEVSRRRHGRAGFSVTLSASRGDARELAHRLRDLAEVERDVRSFGDGADSSTERACDKAAERIEEALR